MSDDAKAVSTSQAPYEVISFMVGEQEFCLDVMASREIRGWTASTTLPQAPDYVLGVINLRGAVLPVIDLRARLGMGSSEPTASHVVIVVEVEGQPVGLVVEAVCDILVIKPEMVQRPPRLGDPNAESLITGIIPLEGRMITQLALANILPQDFDLAA